MDWKEKSGNLNFWIGLIVSVLTPIGAYFGITGADMTSWAIVGDTALKAISNPFVLVTCGISALNAIHNPNTKGFLDK